MRMGIMESSNYKDFRIVTTNVSDNILSSSINLLTTRKVLIPSKEAPKFNVDENFKQSICDNLIKYVGSRMEENTEDSLNDLNFAIMASLQAVMLKGVKRKSDNCMIRGLPSCSWVETDNFIYYITQCQFVHATGVMTTHLRYEYSDSGISIAFPIDTLDSSNSHAVVNKISSFQDLELLSLDLEAYGITFLGMSNSNMAFFKINDGGKQVNDLKPVLTFIDSNRCKRIFDIPSNELEHLRLSKLSDLARASLGLDSSVATFVNAAVEGVQSLDVMDCLITVSSDSIVALNYLNTTSAITSYYLEKLNKKAGFAQIKSLIDPTLNLMDGLSLTGKIKRRDILNSFRRIALSTLKDNYTASELGLKTNYGRMIHQAASYLPANSKENVELKTSTENSDSNKRNSFWFVDNINRKDLTEKSKLFSYLKTFVSKSHSTKKTLDDKSKAYFTEYQRNIKRVTNDYEKAIKTVVKTHQDKLLGVAAAKTFADQLLAIQNVEVRSWYNNVYIGLVSEFLKVSAQSGRVQVMFNESLYKERLNKANNCIEYKREDCDYWVALRSCCDEAHLIRPLDALSDSRTESDWNDPEYKNYNVTIPEIVLQNLGIKAENMSPQTATEQGYMDCGDYVQVIAPSRQKARPKLTMQEYVNKFSSVLNELANKNLSLLVLLEQAEISAAQAYEHLGRVTEELIETEKNLFMSASLNVQSLSLQRRVKDYEHLILLLQHEQPSFIKSSNFNELKLEDNIKAKVMEFIATPSISLSEDVLLLISEGFTVTDIDLSASVKGSKRSFDQVKDALVELHKSNIIIIEGNPITPDDVAGTSINCTDSNRVISFVITKDKDDFATLEATLKEGHSLTENEKLCYDTVYNLVNETIYKISKDAINQEIEKREFKFYDNAVSIIANEENQINGMDIVTYDLHCASSVIDVKLKVMAIPSYEQKQIHYVISVYDVTRDGQEIQSLNGFVLENSQLMALLATLCIIDQNLAQVMIDCFDTYGLINSTSDSFKKDVEIYKRIISSNVNTNVLDNYISMIVNWMILNPAINLSVLETVMYSKAEYPSTSGNTLGAAIMTELMTKYI